MKKFTTSAQKTVSLSKDAILKKLKAEMTKDAAIVFKDTEREYIKECKLEDGSKLVIAAFDKENGKALAMIDHKDLPATNSRADIQKDLRQRLDRIFK